MRVNQYSNMGKFKYAKEHRRCPDISKEVATEAIFSQADLLPMFREIQVLFYIINIFLIKFQ